MHASCMDESRIDGGKEMEPIPSKQSVEMLVDDYVSVKEQSAFLITIF